MSQKKEISASKNEEAFDYSLGVHASYGLGGFLDNFIQAAFTTRLFYYYLVVLNLNFLFLGIAYAIFGVWNMINDIILGNLSDKKYKWTEKWGRRFPWFTFGILTYALSYWALFAAPFEPGTTQQLGKFFWCLITLIAFEFLFSLWQINWLSIFPDKYRKARERTRIGAWTTIWGVFGIVLGVLIPPLIMSEYKNWFDYFLSGLVVGIVTLVAAIASIPGMREDRKLIDRQLKIIEKEEKKETEKFMNILKSSLKDKNFMAYVITYMGHQVMTVFLLGLLPFWNTSVIRSADPDTELVMGIFFLIAVLLGTPFWGFIGKKYGNKKAFMYGTFLTTWLFIPLWFVGEGGLIFTAIILALIGFGIGAIWVLMYPCFSDVMDNIVVRSEERKEGIYTGIRTFFGRFSFVLQAIFFSVIMWATGFNPYAIDPTAPQLGSAIIGLKILFSLIPMIFYFIGFLLMWRVYELDMACVEENKELLQKKLL
jgi:GPH family glycoside/pentoside/hexuronide:cation symporter